MRKALTALAAAATIAAVAASTTAEARRGWRGPAIVGGSAAGAIIIGSAYAKPYAYYGGTYNYGQPAPVYYDYYGLNPIYYDDYAPPQPYDGCWRYRLRYRCRVC